MALQIPENAVLSIPENGKKLPFYRRIRWKDRKGVRNGPAGGRPHRPERQENKAHKTGGEAEARRWIRTPRIHCQLSKYQTGCEEFKRPFQYSVFSFGEKWQDCRRSASCLLQRGDTSTVSSAWRRGEIPMCTFRRKSAENVICS